MQFMDFMKTDIYREAAAIHYMDEHGMEVCPDQEDFLNMDILDIKRTHSATETYNVQIKT